MMFDVEGVEAYCHTGGKPFDARLPAIVFLHGALNDHSVWPLQSRHFAHHGFGVLAPDLPGHGRSKGAALATIEALSTWLLALLDAAGLTQALLVGHSMGSLIALETAWRAPERVTGLALLGSTYPMKVADALLETARSDEAAAIDMVNLWSHAPGARGTGSGMGPGIHTLGEARRLMQRMAALNPHQLLHTDLAACNAYANGEQAARSVACPALFIVGSKDMMTPPRSATLLTGAMAHARTVSVDAGHQMMAEQPGAVLDALIDFAARVAPPAQAGGSAGTR